VFGRKVDLFLVQHKGIMRSLASSSLNQIGEEEVNLLERIPSGAESDTSG
jgi:hypothetical protein